MTRLPADGQHIRWRRRGSPGWNDGICEFVWAMDPSDPVIKIRWEADAYDWRLTDIFPTLGDQWEARDGR